MSLTQARQPPLSANPIDRLCLRVNGEILVLPVRSILYARSDDGITTIQFDSQSLKVRLPLSRLRALLEPFGFFCCHRAFLVNLPRVRRIVPYGADTAELMLDDTSETLIPLAKSRRGALKASLLWP